MPYLIVNDGTPQTVARMRESQFTQLRAKNAIAAWFPQHEVIAPGTQTQSGDRGISVYLVDNFRRKIGKPQGWALRKVPN